jgi:hypothetical protein
VGDVGRQRITRHRASTKNSSIPYLPPTGTALHHLPRHGAILRAIIVL